MGMFAAIDIHKHVFQAAVLDAGSGEVVESRFPATREALAAWVDKWDGRLAAVAIEATCGWRWWRVSCRRRGTTSGWRSRRRRVR